MRWTRQTTVTVMKLGAFALACIVVAAWLVIKVGNIQLFSSDVGYQAVLSDATGLAAGDAVKVSGVTVGRVNSVQVRRGDAVVGFDVQPSVHLRSSTGVGLQWLDVIGDKVLYLYPGNSGPRLRPGATLPLANDVSDASIGALLNNLGPLLQAIDPKEANAFLEAVAGALQGNSAEVHSLLDHTATVAGAVGSVSGQLGSLIDELSTVVTAVAEHKGDLATLTDHLASLSGTLSSNNGIIDATVANLGSAEKDLARLLATNKGTLDGLISHLNGIATDLNDHRGSLALSLHTLPSGLAPYQEISSYGQWFEIDPVFTCEANETSCAYQSPTDAPGGGTGGTSGLGSAGGTGSGAGAAAKSTASGIGSYFRSLAGGS